MRIVFALLCVVSIASLAFSQGPSTQSEAVIDPLASLSQIGAEVEEREDGSLKVVFENEISIENAVLMEAFGTEASPGPMRKLKEKLVRGSI